ncbi:hypothetical protein TWF751_002676 [Orbilia oligospora]|nr:hypothetical protein TWF751_002676 [Orbilia oligospora]
MKPHLCTTKDENSESGDNDALACKLLRSVGSTSLKITYNHGSEGKLKRRDCSQEVMDHDRVSVVYAYKRHTYVSASLGNRPAYWMILEREEEDNMSIFEFKNPTTAAPTSGMTSVMDHGFRRPGSR